MAPLDEIQTGRLIEAVDQLAKAVERMQDELDEIRRAINTARGMLIGMLIIAGMLGAGAWQIVEKLL